MNIKKYLALLLFTPLLAFSMHKYYISLCEIEYVEEQQSVQIILGLFIDDIELTLNKNYKTTFHLATKNEVETVDTLYKTYLQEHFKVFINNKLENYQFIGKKYDDDIVRFYLEIPNITEINTIEVLNTNLIRDFKDQQNIIKIKVKDVNKTFYLDRKNANCLLKI